MGISFRVQSCCWVTNLRTGTMIIGTLDFIGALVTLVVTCVAAVNTYYDWWSGFWEYDPLDDLRPLYLTMAVLSGFLMLVDIVLLYGVSQARPKLILPWIFYAYVSLLSNFICAMIYGIYSFIYNYDTNGYLGIFWSIFYLALKIYFLLVVWSLYHEMKGGAGTAHGNGIPVTIYPTVPIGQQPYLNGPQAYPNGQIKYPNILIQYPNQPQTFSNAEQPNPNVQQPYTHDLKPDPNFQEPYTHVPQADPNVQQPYTHVPQADPNIQQPYSHVPQPDPNVQQPYTHVPKADPNVQVPQLYTNPQQP